MTTNTFDYKNSKLDYKVRMASYNARSKWMRDTYKDDEETLKQELAELFKDKPNEKAIEFQPTLTKGLGRLTFKFPKLIVNKDGKLTGGNVAIINKGYQYMYQPVTGFAFLIDEIRCMDDKDFETLKELTINHLPFSKQHSNPDKAPNQMVNLSENKPFTVNDLHWEVAETK